MTTVFPTIPRRESMELWRRQIGHRHHIAAERGPRPFAIVSYLVRGPLLDERHVDLRRLMLVALFDERLEGGSLATRLVGVSGSVGPDGLCFGGSGLSRLDKDLRLAPAAGGRGPRFDAVDGELLTFALTLERYLERCARHPYFPRRRTPRLPLTLTGNGPPGAYLVDLTTLPKRQVVTLVSPASELCGCYGTTAFDFYHTRFRIAR